MYIRGFVTSQDVCRKPKCFNHFGGGSGGIAL
jgi:hypothetical protein